MSRTPPTEQEVSDVLDDVDDLIACIGDQTVDSVQERQNGVLIAGPVVQRGGFTYQVIARTDTRAVSVQGGFDVANILAREEAADANAQNGHIPESVVNSKRDELRSQVDDETYERVRTALVEQFAPMGLGVQFTSDDIFVSGFSVDDKLYLHDEDIGPTAFNRSVQSVINGVWAGKNRLLSEYDLREDAPDTRADGDPERAFQ